VCVTEGSSSTQRIRVAGHAFRRRERAQRIEEDGVVPRHRGGARGHRVDVEHQSEQHEQEYMEDVLDVQLMDEQELEEELL